MTTVQDNFDSGTDGVAVTGTITTGNSGGVSGGAFANITRAVRVQRHGCSF
jgi:hypothetical protein